MFLPSLFLGAIASSNHQAFLQVDHESSLAEGGGRCSRSSEKFRQGKPQMGKDNKIWVELDKIFDNKVEEILPIGGYLVLGGKLGNEGDVYSLEKMEGHTHTHTNLVVKLYDANIYGADKKYKDRYENETDETRIITYNTIPYTVKTLMKVEVCSEDQERMEYLKYGLVYERLGVSIQDIIDYSQATGPHLPEYLFLEFLLQISQAASGFHDRKLSHNDIGPRNILTAPLTSTSTPVSLEKNDAPSDSLFYLIDYDMVEGLTPDKVIPDYVEVLISGLSFACNMEYPMSESEFIHEVKQPKSLAKIKNLPETCPHKDKLKVLILELLDSLREYDQSIISLGGKSGALLGPLSKLSKSWKEAIYTKYKAAQGFGKPVEEKREELRQYITGKKEDGAGKKREYEDEGQKKDEKTTREDNKDLGNFVYVGEGRCVYDDNPVPPMPNWVTPPAGDQGLRCAIECSKDTKCLSFAVVWYRGNLLCALWKNNSRPISSKSHQIDVAMGMKYSCYKKKDDA